MATHTKAHGKRCGTADGGVPKEMAVDEATTSFPWHTKFRLKDRGTIFAEQLPFFGWRDAEQLPFVSWRDADKEENLTPQEQHLEEENNLQNASNN